jgi:hypothetical protein
MTLSVPNSNAGSTSDERPDKSSQGTNSVVIVNIVLLLLLLVVTVFGYKDVLFDWFSGDDFVHLCWLARTLTEPQLVLHNFYANWLDAFGSAFYRPLVSVSLYFDYLVWHNNGLGFHITNLAFHYVSVVFIYLFAQEIQVAASNNPDPLLAKVEPLPVGWSFYIWPFFAAGLFALHPVHPEVVSWIIGRVDSVATAFVTACLYFYAHWRRTKSPLSLAFGVGSMVLALCSKEIAVLSPVVLTVYEIFFGPVGGAISGNASGDSDGAGGADFADALTAGGGTTLSSRLLAKAKALQHLIAFWVLLAAYFVVRQLALGTWLGGYDNTLGLGLPFSEWLKQTWHGFSITLVPVNVDVISSSNALVRIWTYGSALCGLSLLALISLRRSLREIVFLFAFGVLALLPVYKIFYVMNSNLEASRYAYLLTVPICMLLGLGIARFPLPKIVASRICMTLSIIFGVTLMVGGFGLLRYNNQPWHEAGVTANAILTGLKDILGPTRKTVAANVVLVGPPDAYKGSYICRNAVDFMMQHLNIDPKRSAGVVTILDKQKVFPMSHIRSLMENSPQSIEIWHWDVATKHFVRVNPIVENSNEDRVWSVLQALPGLAKIPPGFAEMMHWENKDLFIDATKGPVVINTDLNKCPTWGLDFLSMNVTRAKGCPPLATPTIAVPSDRGNIYIAGMPLKYGGDDLLVFPLRSVPAWTLDYAKVPALPLIFSNGWKGTLHSIGSIPSQKIMPKTSLKCFGGGNFYRLWKNAPEGHLSVDVSTIPNATGWALEVIPTLDQFSQGNPTKPELNSQMKRFQGVKKDYLLNLHDLPEGFYCLRVWALDKDQQLIGVSSDHYRVQFKE